jgi:cysteine desulfurase
MTPVYLDNNATTPVAKEVLEAMLPYFTEYYGNPSSMHTFGGRVGLEIEKARESVANLIGANPSEIIFTACGTESDNTAIWSAIKSNPGKKHIITSRVEHPAVKNVFELLSKDGYRVTFVPVDQSGRLDLKFLEDHPGDRGKGEEEKHPVPHGCCPGRGKNSH